MNTARYIQAVPTMLRATRLRLEVEKITPESLESAKVAVLDRLNDTDLTELDRAAMQDTHAILLLVCAFRDGLADRCHSSEQLAELRAKFPPNPVVQAIAREIATSL